MVDFGHSVGSLVKRRSYDFLAVEFNSGSLRLSYARSLGQRKAVAGLLDKEIQNLSDDEVAQFINKAIGDFKIRNPRTIYIVPSQLVIAKNIELPSQDPKEIRDIIELQASRHTPYGREEIVTDYINIGVNRKNYTKVLLVIVNREALRKNFEILKKAGVEPVKISFSSETITKALVKPLNLEKEHAPTGVVYIDTTFTVFNVVLKDKVIFVRSIPIGMQNLTFEKDRQWERFVEEVKRSLEVYKNENIDATPSRLIVAGVVDAYKGLPSLLNDSLDIAVEAVSYLDYFSVSEDVQRVCKSSRLVSFFGVMSAAWMFDDVQVNLVPEETKLKRSFEAKSKEVVKTGALLLGIFILVCLLLLSKIYTSSVYLDKLNVRFEGLHKEAEAIEKDFNKMKLVRGYLSNKGYSIEILGELYKFLPEEVKISEVRFDRKKSFAFKGTATSIAVVFALVEDLNKSPYFKEVKTKYTSKRKEDDIDVADFEIVASFLKND